MVPTFWSIKTSMGTAAQKRSISASRSSHTERRLGTCADLTGVRLPLATDPLRPKLIESTQTFDALNELQLK